MTTRSLIPALATVAMLIVAGCGPRSTVTEGPAPASQVNTVVKPTATSTQRPDPAGEPVATTTLPEEGSPLTEAEAQVSAELGANADEGTQVGGDQAAAPEVSIPDASELDDLLSDIDAVLAGIDLDADEGDLP